MILVSACLLGDCCKYSGGHNDHQGVHQKIQGKPICKVCPEREGGLPTPRPPAEIVGNRIQTNQGMDVTDAFDRGAILAWEVAKQAAKELGEPIELAILKANSPSCGSQWIYDGTFSGKKIKGNGRFARLVKQQGIPVWTEEDMDIIK